MDEYQNLRGLLEKGVSLDDLVAVRAFSSSEFNRKGDRFYASPKRPTIHFSLNHLVQNHNYGKWDHTDSVIITPIKELVENNQDNLYGGSTSDIFLAGYANIPNATILNKNGESHEKFRERVNEQVEKLGYKVLPGGMWAWGDSWKATDQLVELFKQLKKYEFGAHSNTIFGQVEDMIFDADETKRNQKQELYLANFKTICSREGKQKTLDRFMPYLKEWQRYWSEAGKLAA
ncbi:MAG: hypothetical protein AABW51_03260 [Nanoarchaeota archaeon]